MKLFPAPLMVEDEKILARPSATFDVRGVVNVPLMSPQGFRSRYVPTTICQFAMANYNLFLKTGLEKYRMGMDSHVAWLMENFAVKDGFGVWEYAYDYSAPGYDCRAPWVSCMAQGQGISALVRAYDLSPDEEKAKVAKLASKAFGLLVEEGGVRRPDSHGCAWYKEYACRGAPTVLNGMIFGLIGLKELSDYFGDKEAEQRFEEGVRALRLHIAKFEVGVYPLLKWSRYDDGYILLAARRYHEIHVRQLERLYRLTGEEVFRDYSVRWRRYGDIYPRTPLYRAVNGVARRAGNFSQLKSMARKKAPGGAG